MNTIKVTQRVLPVYLVNVSGAIFCINNQWIDRENLTDEDFMFLAVKSRSEEDAFKLADAKGMNAEDLIIERWNTIYFGSPNVEGYNPTGSSIEYIKFDTHLLPQLVSYYTPIAKGKDKTE